MSPFLLFAQPQELLQRANRGDAKSQLELGVWYSNQGDHTNSVYWYKKSAEQGNAIAQYNYGCCLASVGDFKEAFKWIEKAAYQDQMSACYQLGLMYLNGEGTFKDLGYAGVWIEAAVKLGIDNKLYNGEKVAERQLNLVKTMIREIEPYNKEVDGAFWMVESKDASVQKEGFALLQSLAQQKNGKAEGYLSKCYQYGIGVEPNREKAFEYARVGANDKDLYSLCELGIHYAKGEFVAKDYDEAIRLLEIAANRNYHYACYTLGVIYGEKGDRHNEVEWYKKACDLGNVFAFWNLAEIYHDAKLTDASFSLYQMAEQRISNGTCLDLFGDNGARFQNMLGEYYYLGIPPVSKDVNIALAWYKKAATNGNKLAKNRLNEINNR